METVTTVGVLLAMIALGVLLMQLFTTRHGDPWRPCPPAVPGGGGFGRGPHRDVNPCTTALSQIPMLLAQMSAVVDSVRSPAHPPR